MACSSEADRVADIAGNITSGHGVLIKNAEVAGQHVDVNCSTVVEAVAPSLPVPAGDVQVVDAQGAALLPGLHDHHIHLRATAAALRSLDCSEFAPGQSTALQTALSQVVGDSWIRVVGYHESIAGDLDAAALDALCAGRPVRVQHASGKLWTLNTSAMRALGLAGVRDQPGVERDAHGRPTGRLWRMDDWLGQRVPAVDGGLQDLSQQLASFGITGVTDTSYNNSEATAVAFEQARQRGELQQHVRLLGDDGLRVGGLKIMLDEDDLPDLEKLAARLARAHRKGRVVAFHCISHIELLFALNALQLAEVRSGVRIEHGGVIHSEVIPQLLECGATVVTQPGFIAQRGERFRRQAAPQDLDALYPYASLLAAGVPVAASSDAPYGPLNPWHNMRAAVERRTEAEQSLGRRECVPPSEALRGYLASPERPGGEARRISPGAPADLCLLDRSLGQAYEDIGAVNVNLTLVAGREIYASSASTSSVCSPK